MYKIDCCPACGDRSFREYAAIVAPFLAHYAIQCNPSLCSLLECRACTLRFFDSRLTDEEMRRLYSSYRGAEYFQVRHMHEPWYSKRINDGIGGDPQEIEARKAGLANFLNEQSVATGEINAVLDYGGDRGQFIPDHVGRSKYVYELSDAAPAPGVVRIGSQQELNESRFDLVILCGVLEHCSEPAEVLKGVRRIVRDAKSACIIGVPFERYGLGFVGRGVVYRRYLNTLLSIKRVLTLLDFWSTAGRTYGGFVPPFGLVKCHEHLNFFNEKSMTALVQAAGFEVTGWALAVSGRYPVRMQSLYVLAKPVSTN